MARHLSFTERVRQALKLMRSREPVGSVEKKRRVISAAAWHEFATGDIEDMQAEIEMGYSTSSNGA